MSGFTDKPLKKLKKEKKKNYCNHPRPIALRPQIYWRHGKSYKQGKETFYLKELQWWRETMQDKCLLWVFNNSKLQ